MYREYRKALDNFLDYKGNIDNRIKDFKSEIQTKELEVKSLQDSYTKAFMNGTNASDSKLKALKVEISTDKEQLQLILEAVKNDSQLDELGKDVYSEYLALQEEVKRDQIKDSEALELLESKYEQDRQILLDSKYEMSMILENEYIRPRVEAIPYMQITKIERMRIEGKL